MGVIDGRYERFHRRQGLYAGQSFDLEGNPISDAEFEQKRAEWLPTQEDKDYLVRIMQPVRGVGQIANWIAPPRRGINGLDFEFEYVRI